jgi:hypothetical protein
MSSFSVIGNGDGIGGGNGDAPGTTIATSGGDCRLCGGSLVPDIVSRC